MTGHVLAGVVIASVALTVVMLMWTPNPLYRVNVSSHNRRVLLLAAVIATGLTAAYANLVDRGVL